MINAKDVQVGDYLVFDPDNIRKQLESGINAVQVHRIERKYLRYHVYTFAIHNETGDINTSTGIDFKSNLRGEIPMLGKLIPKKTVIVRYPDNMPVISAADCQVYAKMAATLFTGDKDHKGFSDEELIRINSLLKKMQFYTGITEHYKNIYGGGGG